MLLGRFFFFILFASFLLIAVELMAAPLPPRTTMLFYFIFPAGSRTSFMILTQCCRFPVLLTCTVWRPSGWMTAFGQSFTGDDMKYKDYGCYFMKSKLKFSLGMHSDRGFFTKIQ